MFKPYTMNGHEYNWAISHIKCDPADEMFCVHFTLKEREPSVRMFVWPSGQRNNNQVALGSHWQRMKLSLIFSIEKPPWAQNTHAAEHPFLPTPADALVATQQTSIQKLSLFLLKTLVRSAISSFVNLQIWQRAVILQFPVQKVAARRKRGGGKENFPAGFLLQMKNESQHRSDKPHRPKQSTAQSPRLLLCPLRGTASLGDQLCSSESPCAWWPVAESAELSLTAAISETFIFIPLF